MTVTSTKSCISLNGFLCICTKLIAFAQCSYYTAICNGEEDILIHFIINTLNLTGETLTE